MKAALGLVLVALGILLAFAGGPDDDGDGVPNDLDCRPNDPDLWAAPAAGVQDLALGLSSGTATLTWSRPPDLGCMPGVERYDALVAQDVTDFGFPYGFCAGINLSGLSTTDERVPAPAAASYYLVRVENECGPGPLDSDPPPVVPRSAEFVEVTNLDDSGPGSLRAALAAAVDSEAICVGPTGTLALTSGPLTVNRRVAIAGPGAEHLTIDGGGATSVLRLWAFSSVSDLTVSAGEVGIAIGDGAIITRDTIQGNAVGLDVGQYTYDSVITTTTIQGNDIGIFADGYYTYPAVSSSTIRDNGIGVALYGYYTTLHMNSSTIAENDVGLVVSTGGSIHFVGNTTVADNQVGLRLHDDTVLGNSIVSNAVDCDGQPGKLISVAGTNLITDTDCGAPEDLHTDPRLGPLGLYGGPTETFALLPDSPAIDAGACYPTGLFAAVADQRGAPRPVDQAELPDTFNSCDMGAYEVQSDFECTCEITQDCDFPDSCYAGCVCRYLPFCGSGICDPGEDAFTCIEDCPADCGNDLVEPGEECEVPADCPPCPIGQAPTCDSCACGCVPFP